MVAVAFSSFPIVDSDKVPTDVAQACEQGPNGNGEFDVQRSLFRKILVTAWVESKLAAQFEIEFMEQRIPTGNTIRAR